MIIPPRYYISFIENEFMAGGVNEIRLANALYLTVLGLLLFAGIYKKTQMRLED
jgi:ABC-2 type transport system permease protein